MSATTGGPAFPTVDQNREADYGTIGMTLHDYAAIRFSAAWTIALGSKEMSESHREQAWEANHLGRLQADDFIAQRGLASQPDTTESRK